MLLILLICVIFDWYALGLAVSPYSIFIFYQPYYVAKYFSSLVYFSLTTHSSVWFIPLMITFISLISLCQLLKIHLSYLVNMNIVDVDSELNWYCYSAQWLQHFWLFFFKVQSLNSSWSTSCVRHQQCLVPQFTQLCMVDWNESGRVCLNSDWVTFQIVSWLSSDSLICPLWKHSLFVKALNEWNLPMSASVKWIYF